MRASSESTGENARGADVPAGWSGRSCARLAPEVGDFQFLYSFPQWYEMAPWASTHDLGAFASNCNLTYIDAFPCRLESSVRCSEQLRSVHARRDLLL